MENNSTLEKMLLMCDSNAELLQLVEATIDSKMAFFKRMRKNILIILEKLQKKVRQFFLFVFVDIYLSCQISIESVRKIVICSLNVLKTVLYLNFFSIL